MVLYPEVQRKAQAEIDRVIGSDRLPGLADQSSLPYVDALVKEVFRWSSVTPLGEFAVFRSHELLFPFVQGKADGRDSARDRTCCFQGRRLRRVFYSQGNSGDRKHLVSEGKKEEISLSKFFL